MAKRFTRPAAVLLLAIICSSASADQTMVQLEDGFKNTVQPFVQTYCVSCHGKEKPKGEIDLSAYSTLASVTRGHEQWQIVLEQLKGGIMPPKQAPEQPTPEERRAVVEWIEAQHKYESEKNAGDPGPVLARRLSNAEYDYTIRDLTGVDIRPTRTFPVDPANEAGFDNSGESLSMSPALVKKYLDAARLVSEHMVLTSKGITFAPHPMVAETDRDKYAVNQIIQFYKRQPTDYTDYFEAAWRFHHRAALGQPQVTLPEVAAEMKISPKYLARIWTLVNDERQTLGPIAVIQSRWDKLPVPEGGKQPDAVRPACQKMRDFIVDLRPWVAMDYANLPARGIASGSQTVVLWKDRTFALNRMNYTGNALEVDMSAYRNSEPAMLIPQNEADKARYNDSFHRFCAIFPDAFYISERGRMFLVNANERERERRDNTGRFLSAGFHSQMGYFRDDQPLCELILDSKQQAELDALWRELDFITLAPKKQLKQFIWFERAEPPSFMYTSEFNSFRSEDADITSEAKVKQLGDTYLAKAARNNNEMILDVIQDYFERINRSIRAVEQARLAAEPNHLEALLGLSERAFRRPLSQSERADIIAFYESLRTSASLDHEDAIRDTFTSVLMSPYFSYRVDPSPAAGAVQPLTDYALANRLSYFLWSSMPDEKLLARAKAGDLHRPEVLVAETRRMLRDPRIENFAKEFGGNWLDFRRFEEHNAVDRERFPSFTNDLREAMFEEPVRFMIDMVQNDRSVLDFLYGNYTFVNPILAKHYGMPEMTTSPDEWVRIDNAGQYRRGGLLPMSVFMTQNSPGLRTSPVKRGYWVVRRIVGEHIPAPPPDVPVLPEDEKTGLGELTLRQTLEKHREDPSCATCHAKFDSFGLVFEGFGPIGETRTLDLGNRPVDTTATFPNGSQGTGLEGLQKYIRDHRQSDFIDNLCRKMLVYSLGRSLLPSDELLVREMNAKLASNEYRFSSLVETIVTSRQFLNRRGDSAKE